MKPVMFCRNTSGIRRLQASSTKCAPFWADSAKRMPRLARIADGVALDAGEAADEGVAVQLLELGEAGAVDEPGDHLERVELVPEVLGDDAVEVGRVDGGRLRRRELPRARRGVAEVAHDLACEAERVLVGDGVVVGDAGAPGVDVGAAELLRRHLLPGGGLHERRAADEDRARAARRSPSRRTSPARTRLRPCTIPSRRRSARSPCADRRAWL